MTLDTKAKFNALQNAKHIFAFKEEQIEFKILEIVDAEVGCKAVVMTKDGEVEGLFTDSASAKYALNEVYTVFGKDQPFIKVNLKTTPKGASVYFVEVL
ncbi:hypothetical protein [Herbiconiux daphne]|uniref:Uncharacterized protein n=1 Tax=Herbiconiux daphne TaxID=2970914 RepID=A0ABT2H9N9_9MICO|nr:hypothetical protein [Herbiconiux daphne]MCS5736675.1 hypothetical protein [Herbiconiux daphne]